jgi:hypothetical protein
VGASLSGANPIPNGVDGIDVDQTGATVGGPGRAANTVAFNLGRGIRVQDVDAIIAANSVFSNGGLGIDHDPAGVTANDAADADGIQNVPNLSAALAEGANTAVVGSINTAPNRSVTLRFFSSPVCDDSGFGEGKTPLGRILLTANRSGHARFDVELPAASTPGEQVTATASSSAGSSEFSGCQPVVAGRRGQSRPRLPTRPPLPDSPKPASAPATTTWPSTQSDDRRST